MRPFASLLLATAVVAASPAAARDTASADSRAQASLAKALQGRIAGRPVDCITLSNVSSTRIIDRTAILYDTGGGRLYVNTPSIGRESLDDDDILVTRTFGSELCRLDTVRLVDRGSRFETGFVGLGPFVPYTKPRKD